MKQDNNFNIFNKLDSFVILTIVFLHTYNN